MKWKLQISGYQDIPSNLYKGEIFVSKEKREMLSKFMLCSHKWTKELTSVYTDVSYKTQLSFCMKELMRQKKANEHNLFQANLNPKLNFKIEKQIEDFKN